MSKNPIFHKNKHAERNLPDNSLSIIVPVFNTERYVLDALCSLEGERPGFHEIIVVHDGGVDDSFAQICQWADTTNSPVVVIDQENKGLSAARHAGLEVARGDFIAFLDSDDFIVPGLYSRMLDLALNHDCHIVLCHAQVLNESDGSFWDFYDTWLWDKMLRGRNFITTNIFNDPLLLRLEPNANRKVVRRDFMEANAIGFEAGMLFEDLPPHVDEMALASCIGLLNESGYFYRVNRSGKITEEKGASRFDMIKSAKLSLDKGRQHDLEALAGAALVSSLVRMVFWCSEFIFLSQREKYFYQACAIFKEIPDEWMGSLVSFWGRDHRDSILAKNFQSGNVEFLMQESFEHKLDAAMQDFSPDNLMIIRDNVHEERVRRSFLNRVVGKIRSFSR